MQFRRGEYRLRVPRGASPSAAGPCSLGGVFNAGLSSLTPTPHLNPGPLKCEDALLSGSRKQKVRPRNTQGHTTSATPETVPL